LLKKDYKKAKELSQELSQKGSSRSIKQNAEYYLGISYIKLGEYSKARSVLKVLVKDSLEKKLRDRAYLGIIDSLFFEEYYGEALEFSNKLLKLSPKSDYLSLIYLKLARINMKLSRWDTAKGHLRKIVKYFPGSPEVSAAKQFLEEEQFFAVQVGAFLDQGRASMLARELKRKGEYAYVVETVSQDGRKYYRVRAGKLGYLKDARRLKAKLSKLGYPTAIYP